MKKSGVDAAKISAAKKRKKATTLVVAKKGKKPAPKAAAASTKSGIVRLHTHTHKHSLPQPTNYLQSLKRKKPHPMLLRAATTILQLRLKMTAILVRMKTIQMMKKKARTDTESAGTTRLVLVTSTTLAIS